MTATPYLIDLRDPGFYDALAQAAEIDAEVPNNTGYRARMLGQLADIAKRLRTTAQHEPTPELSYTEPGPNDPGSA